MKRSRHAAALMAIAVAVGLLAGCGSVRAGAGSGPQPAARPSVVVVDCTGKPQTRPADFVLTCADANDALMAVHWVDWAAGQAFGTGTEKINACTPDCANGKLVSYPALIVLWRPEPLPGHPGVRHFTRATRIYTAARPPYYGCPGQHVCYPQTSTFDLWSG